MPLKHCVAGHAIFFLNENKAKKCIELFDMNDDEVWSKDEWARFDEILAVMKVVNGKPTPVNVYRLNATRANSSFCLFPKEQIFNGIASSDPSDKDKMTISDKDLILNFWRPKPGTLIHFCVWPAFW